MAGRAVGAEADSDTGRTGTEYQRGLDDGRDRDAGRALCVSGGKGPVLICIKDWI